MSRCLLLPILLLALAGCEPDVARPGADGRVPGAIVFFGDTGRIAAPAEAAVGADIPVSVETFGGACMGMGDTEVRVHDLLAVVSPYDYEAHLPPNTACIMILVGFRHEAVVRFPRPGRATLVVRGQSQPGGRIITLARTIRVQ